MLIPIILAAAGGLIGIVYEKSKTPPSQGELDTVQTAAEVTSPAGPQRKDITQVAMESIRLRKERLRAQAEAEAADEARQQEYAQDMAHHGGVFNEGQYLTHSWGPGSFHAPPSMSEVPAGIYANQTPQSHRTPPSSRPQQQAYSSSPEPHGLFTASPLTDSPPSAPVSAPSPSPPQRQLSQLEPQDSVLTAIQKCSGANPEREEQKKLEQQLAKQRNLRMSVEAIHEMLHLVPDDVRDIWGQICICLKALAELTNIIGAANPSDVTLETKMAVFKAATDVENLCKDFLAVYDTSPGANAEKVEGFRRHLQVVCKETANMHSYISKRIDFLLTKQVISR